ncbi:MAG: DUF1566 domain-containing protein [Bacteroidales bacterium]|nr:DUF1566 domain-containing protein [Bacteroidales bacterium]
MKKTLLILSIITLVLAGCKKFDEIEASKVEIIEENIEKGWDYIYFDVEYDYPVELEAVNIYIAENNDMNYAKSYSCNVNENRFNVKIENVNFDKKYYFYYEFEDGYSIDKTEVKKCIINRGYEYVDLGLPSGLLWASCNVGATTPEGYGDYFAWGKTTTKTDYSSSNCPTYGLSYSSLQSQGYIDNNGNLTAQHDAATANWGGDWRMPTYEELKELKNNCTWTWTTHNGVNGYKVTSKVNSNYIFLPAAGYRGGSSLYYAGSSGYYWGSTPYGSYSNYAFYLFFNSSRQGMFYGSRNNGRSVRPVIE